MDTPPKIIKLHLVRRISIILTVILLLITSSFAQSEKLPFFKKVTHPFMPSITSEYFFFSKDGLMWFSTAQGLTSFDGSEIIFYSSLKQANELGLNRISGVVEDKDHDFYLATQHGLCFYDRRNRIYQMLSYTFSNEQKRHDIDFAPLLYDNDGLIYAGSKNNGLFIYDPHSKRFQHFNLDPNKIDSWEDYRLNTVSSIVNHAIDSNKLWIGTYHGIYLFDKKNKTFERRFELINPGHSLPGTVTPEHYDIQKMEIENDSIIWFNSWTGGIGKYNTHTGKVKLFLHDARIKTPEQSVGFVMPKFGKLGNNQYLLGIYDDKSAIFNSLTEKVTYFKVTETNFPQEQTRFVTRDNHGNLWLLQKGFIYVKLPDSLRLQSVNIPRLTATSFSKPVVRGMYFDDESHLFYITIHGSIGVHVYDTNFVLQKIISTGLIHNYYTFNESLDTKITKDGSKRFWTVGWKNFLLTPDEKKFEPLEKKIPSLKWLTTYQEPSDITTTRYGNILFKINGALTYQINHLNLSVDTIRCPKMKPDKSIVIKEASVWYDDKRDYVYQTRGEGIAQYNLVTKKMRVIPYESLFGNLPPNEGVCAPTLDGAGRICLMIPKYGIRIIDPESLCCTDSIQYGAKGLMRGDYTAAIGGNKNYFLLRSQNGIVIYDFVKQQSFLFDQSNGLSSPDNKVFLYCNGYLIVSQAGQVDYCKLSNLDNYSAAITPYLNSIFFDTTTIYIRNGFEKNRTIKLAHNQNTLSFSFSASEFVFPERIEYAYQLIPVDNDWHYTNYFNRKIIYSKLSPGSYSFRLKAQIQGGNWDVDPVEYDLIIKPAWWQTKIFIISIFILVLILAIWISRWRIRNVRKQEREKGKIEKQILELEAKALRAQMNPHFIFNCLNSIKSLIQQHEEEKSVIYLTTFSKLIRTLFNNADKKEISLYDEIETCKLYLQLEAMRFDSKFSYTVNVDENIDLKAIQIPALIVQPFIENAIWHGIVPSNNGGHISLDVGKQDSIVEIIVDDNGIGRETSLQNKSASNIAHQSKGVNLTQSRLELNNLLQQRQAKLETIDKKDEHGAPIGTMVIIKIKEELS